MRLSKVSGALRHRNFCIFYFGYGVSLTGSWVQTITTAWLVYRLTGSGFWLGAAAFAGQVPAFLLAPLGGVFADRCSRKNIVLLTQSAAMAQAFMAGILLVTGKLTIDKIIIMEIFLGSIKALDVPVRQALILDLVEDRKDVQNAVALNSILFNSARLIGPLVAALIISKAGEVWSYFLNGASFTAVLLSLSVIKMDQACPANKKTGVSAELIEGINYAFKNVPVVILISACAFFNFLPVMALYPVFAHDILFGSSGTYGLMVSTSGMGALAGALFLANLRSPAGLGSSVTIAAFSLAAGTVALSFTSSFACAGITCFSVGGATMILNAGSNTILQRICDPSKRGRVLSLWIMAAMGASPLGSFVGGLSTHLFGIKSTYLASGVVGLAGVAVFCIYIPRINKALSENIS